MLRLLIGICILGLVQGKAFPKKYKRSYNSNYDYDSLPEGFEVLNPEYIQNILPYHEHYTHEYIPARGYQWSYVEHHPISNPTRVSHEDQSFHNKIKSKHTWHFIDQNHEIPINHYTDESHEELEHQVGIPLQKSSNKKESEESNVFSQNKPDKTSTKKPHLPVNEYELPIVVDRPTKKRPATQWDGYELPVVEVKPVKDKPVNYEKPVVDKEKPVKEKPIKVDEYEKPVVIAELIQKERPFHDEEDDKPIVVAELIQKERPFREEDEKLIDLETVAQRPMKTQSIVDKKTIHAVKYKVPVVANPIVKEKHSVWQEPQQSNFHEGMNEKIREPIPKDSIIKKEDIGSFVIPVEAFEELEEEHEMPKERELSSENSSESEEEFDDDYDESDSGSGLDIEVPDDTSRSLESLVSRVRMQERRKFKSCITPKNESGHCMPFQLCSVTNIASNVDELLRNVCIIDDVFFGICCPEFPVETVRVDWGQFLKPDTDTFKEEPTQIVNECGNLPSTIKDGDSWPWMASLIARSSDKIFCGGALIKDQYVLTAAHCTVRIPRNQILVRLEHPDSRKSSGQDLEVIEIKRHAGYNPRTMQNDIALLKLSKRVRLGEFRRLICLTNDDKDFVNKSASLLHWKGTLGEIGDVESLPVISNEECQTRMRSVIPDSILCAEPRTESMCNTDSGAPFIISEKEKFKVIGLLTWNRNDCDERFPTIFTRVSNYSRWIQKHAS